LWRFLALLAYIYQEEWTLVCEGAEGQSAAYAAAIAMAQRYESDIIAGPREEHRPLDIVSAAPKHPNWAVYVGTSNLWTGTEASDVMDARERCAIVVSDATNDVAHWPHGRITPIC